MRWIIRSQPSYGSYATAGVFCDAATPALPATLGGVVYGNDCKARVGIRRRYFLTAITTNIKTQHDDLSCVLQSLLNGFALGVSLGNRGNTHDEAALFGSFEYDGILMFHLALLRSVGVCPPRRTIG
jgi:hypothetical protein